MIHFYKMKISFQFEHFFSQSRPEEEQCRFLQICELKVGLRKDISSL